MELRLGFLFPFFILCVCFCFGPAKLKRIVWLAYHPQSTQNCRSIVLPLRVLLSLYDLRCSDPVMRTEVLEILRMLAEARACFVSFLRHLLLY
jgi:hypothetical protein